MGVKVRARNGTWWVYVHYHRRRVARKVGSRQAAETVKRQLEARLALGDLGVLSEKQSPTFRDYSEKWLRQYAEIQCKASTVASYQQLLRLYVLPRFGTHRLDQIARDGVKEFLATLSGSGLARNSIRLALATLRVILTAAMDDGLIDRNPASRLFRFTRSEKPQFQATALTAEEANRLLSETKDYCPEYWPLFLVALRAGLRRGELVALQWGDVNFGESDRDSDRYILVQHNYVYGRFTTTKSKKSRRVDMSRKLRSVLLTLRDTHLLRAFSEGKASVADDLVFPSTVGTVLDPDNLEKNYFKPCVERAGLRNIRFHDLRHTFGSLLIQTGAPLTYVRDQMGHHSIQVTADVYGHLVPGANVGWVDRLDSLYPRTSPQQNATQAQPASEEQAGKPLQPIEKNGEPWGNRTLNLLIKSQLLYQLS